jgi:hypothetical protein
VFILQIGVFFVLFPLIEYHLVIRLAVMLRVGPSPKFGIAFFIFLASYIFVSIASGVALWRMPKPSPGWPFVNGTNAVLPDIGFDSIPYLGSALCTTEGVFIGLPTFILILFMLFTLWFSLHSSRSTEILIRFMLVESALLAMRAVSITITALTNPDPRCANCEYGCPSSLMDAIKMTVTRFPFWSCGDLVFSGHTVEFFCTASVWMSYCNSKFLRLTAASTAVLGAASLVGCRYHYSIDIFIAVLLSHVTWSVYPYLLNFGGSRIRAPMSFRVAACCVQWLNGCSVNGLDLATHYDHERQPLVATAGTSEFFV